MLSTALALSHELKKIPPQADFEALERLFYQRNSEIIDGYQEQSKKYDVETNHGYTQGAYL